MAWISEYEQAIRDAGIDSYEKSSGIGGGWFGDQGYYPFRKQIEWFDANRGKAEIDCPVDRFSFVRKYGFAIPGREALNRIAHYACGGTGVVEVGAGMGYWLYESLKIAPQRGWVATDASPPVEGKALPRIPIGISHNKFDFTVADANPYGFEKLWAEVEKLSGIEAVQKYSDHTLLMIWPSFGEKWAFETLQSYSGKTLLYIGEGSGGCCAEDDFWELIEKDWIETETIRIPFWWGIHDRMILYKRK